jgi:polyvinyl alcohol dehydrogenase (cytochrome)
MKTMLVSLILGGAALSAGAVPPSTQPAAADDLTTFRAAMDAGKAGVDREKLPGAAIYHERCQKCHEGQAPKAPSRTFIELMTPEAIDRALTIGIMQMQSAGLSDSDKQHVAEYLSGIQVGAAQPPEAPRCTGGAAGFSLDDQPRITGWGFTPDNNHFAPANVAELAAADIPRLKLKWAFAYPTTVRARSRPTFAFGALFVGSQNGTVYALDAQTGCIRWTFRTTAEVRTAIVVPPRSPRERKEPPLAFFGDLIGRVYAVDATSGREIWRVKADPHPSTTITGSPLYYRGTLYVPVSSLEEASADPTYACCTFRGSVLALDARTGRELWRRYTIDETAHEVARTKIGTKIFAPSGAAVWNTPTLDAKRGRLYVGTGNNYTGPANGRSNAIMALDIRSGAVAWEWQVVGGDAWNVGCMVGLDSCPHNPGPDYDIGSGTMLVKLADGRERILVGLKSGLVVGIDPDTHDRALWKNQVGRGSIQGGIQFGMAFDGERLYVPIADMGDSKDASSKERDRSAGPPRPGLYAIDAGTGQLLWSSPADDVCRGRAFCDPGILASIAAIPGAVFTGHMDGRVRAYDAATGRVLWQTDTTPVVTALGGGMAHGGAIGGGGPVVYHGIVYANSGYGLYFHMPGNLLAAYSVDGK